MRSYTITTNRHDQNWPELSRKMSQTLRRTLRGIINNNSILYIFIFYITIKPFAFKIELYNYSS